MARILAVVAILFAFAALLEAATVLTLSSTKLLADHNAPRTAYGLPGLVWDTRLASNAQSHANACSFAHSTSTQRGTAYATAKGITNTNTFANSVGENLAANAGSSTIDISGWNNEKPYWTCSTNVCAAGKVCGHYTQVIWEQTLRVGCGAATCSTNSPFGSSWPTWNLLTCRYNPAGNWVGSHPLGSAAKCSFTPATWTNYGQLFQTMGYSGSTAIFFGGLATTGTGTWSSNVLIRSVAAAINPSNRLIFLAAVNANVLGRVDVLTLNGNTNVQWVVGGSGSGWISLDNIVYSRSAQVAVTFANGWVNYGTTYLGGSFVNDTGAVYLAGLVKHTAFPLNKHMFVLPTGFRPQNREIFPSSCNNAYCRVDVLPTGNVSLISATGTSGHVSLSNVRFRPSGTTFANCVMSSAWVTYSGYAACSSSVGTDGRVFLRGLVRAGTAATIATLPAGSAPAAKRLFIAACSTGACRVDITNTGVVSLVGKTYGTTTGAAAWPSWVSLSGIAYDPSVDFGVKRSIEVEAELPSLVL